jgi:hypothetical protein
MKHRFPSDLHDSLEGQFDQGGNCEVLTNFFPAAGIGRRSIERTVDSTSEWPILAYSQSALETAN